VVAAGLLAGCGPADEGLPSCPQNELCQTRVVWQDVPGVLGIQATSIAVTADAVWLGTLDGTLSRWERGQQADGLDAWHTWTRADGVPEDLRAVVSSGPAAWLLAQGDAGLALHRAARPVGDRLVLEPIALPSSVELREAMVAVPGHDEAVLVATQQGVLAIDASGQATPAADVPREPVLALARADSGPVLALLGERQASSVHLRDAASGAWARVELPDVPALVSPDLIGGPDGFALLPRGGPLVVVDGRGEVVHRTERLPPAVHLVALTDDAVLAFDPRGGRVMRLALGGQEWETIGRAPAPELGWHDPYLPTQAAVDAGGRVYLASGGAALTGPVEAAPGEPVRWSRIPLAPVIGTDVAVIGRLGQDRLRVSTATQLFDLQPSQVEPWSRAAVFPEPPIGWALGQLPDGTEWVAGQRMWARPPGAGWLAVRGGLVGESLPDLPDDGQRHTSAGTFDPAHDAVEPEAWTLQPVTRVVRSADGKVHGLAPGSGDLLRWDPESGDWIQQASQARLGRYLGDSAIWSLTSSASDGVWVTSPVGAVRVVGSSVEEAWSPPGQAVGLLGPIGVLPTAAGTWLHAASGSVRRLGGGGSPPVSVALDRASQSLALAPVEGPEGRIWLAGFEDGSLVAIPSGAVPQRLVTVEPARRRRHRAAVAPLSGESGGELICWARGGGVSVSTRVQSTLRAGQAVPFVGGVAHLSAGPDACWATTPLGRLYRIGERDHQVIPLPDGVHARATSATASGRVWVATDAGLLHLDADGAVLHRVEPGEGLPVGTVDHVLALADGGALAVFNAFPADWPLSEGTVPESRRHTTLARVDARGQVVDRRRIPTDDGAPIDILSIAQGLDGEIWLGTRQGLGRWHEGELSTVTAGGRLPRDPVEHLVVDGEGQVWFARPGTERGPAIVIGYTPSEDDFQVFDAERGLPEAGRVDMLVALPTGQLLALAGGTFVHGRVHPNPLGGGSASGVIGSVCAGGCVVLLVGFPAWGFWTSHRERKRREREQQEAFREITELTQRFFEQAGFTVERRDVRALTASRQRADGTTESTLIWCTNDPLVPVQDVLDAHAYCRSHHTSGGPGLLWLVHRRELDPAARRQLDVIRINDADVLIPVPQPLIAAKLAEGEASARITLDGLYSRYLGQQNLFEKTNAVEDSRFFYGRSGVIADIQKRLARGEHVAVYGRRKVGKTSLLNRLQLALDAFPLVKLDMQVHQRDDPAWPQQVLGEVLARYDQWGGVSFGPGWDVPPAPERPDGSTFRAALLRRRALQLALGNPQPLVLLIDEMERVFPRLDVPDRAHIQRYVSAVSVLRALGQADGERHLAIVIADIRTPFNRVNHFPGEGVDTNPFYQFFQELPLAPLSLDECTEMLTDLGSAMGIRTVEPAFIRAVYLDSGGHPALARKLAAAAVDAADDRSRIDLDDYERGLMELEDRAGEPYVFFQQSVWTASTPHEQAVLQAVVRGQELVPAGLDDDARYARGQARALLAATQVIERAEDGAWRVRGRLLAEWLLARGA